VREHNLWVTRADGSGLRQLTNDGTSAAAYEDPSISDNGVVAAMRSGDIVLMRQDGTSLGILDPKNLFVPNDDTLWITPAFDPAISDDGSKIAYSQIRAESYGGEIVTETLTAFTDTSRLSDVAKYGIAVGGPASWVTGNRVTINRNGDVHLYDLTSESTFAWFRQDDFIPNSPTDPFDFVGFSDASVSADRRRVLFRFGPVSFGSAATREDPATGHPAPPNGQPQCWINSDIPASDGKNVIESPTFGPDSDSVAYEEAGDLWLLQGISVCDASTTMTKVASNAHDPAWSAATLTNPKPGPQPQPQPQHKSFRLKAKPKITGRPVVHARLRATAGRWDVKPQRTTFAWLRNGKVIKGATSPVYRVKRADRGDRLAVRVLVRRDGYKPSTALSAARRVKR
jgi:uncharacterized cupin superfamily protein